MRNIIITLLLPLALVACRNDAPAPTAAKAYVASTRQATLGDAVLNASTLRLSALNTAMAKQYGIDTAQTGVLLLVTLRDAQGNALAPTDLQLTATASVLPEPAKPLELRVIQTNGMTDYLGVLHANPPASVQFKLSAKRSGASSEVAITTDLQPH